MRNKTHRGKDTVSRSHLLLATTPEGQGGGQAHEEKGQHFPRTKQPSIRDQLVVLLMSLGLALFVLALGYRAGWMVELVLVIIVTFSMLTINLLFAFSREDP
jgi:hypothetical protein